jgi:hypothetical protein
MRLFTALLLLSKIWNCISSGLQHCMVITLNFCIVRPSPRPGSGTSLDRLNSMSPAARRLASTQLRRRIGSDLALQASYSPSPHPSVRNGQASSHLTPSSAKTPNPGKNSSARRNQITTPNLNITDNLLNLPKRPRAADFFWIISAVEICGCHDGKCQVFVFWEDCNFHWCLVWICFVQELKHSLCLCRWCPVVLLMFVLVMAVRKYKQLLELWQVLVDETVVIYQLVWWWYFLGRHVTFLEILTFLSHEACTTETSWWHHFDSVAGITMRFMWQHTK